MDPKGEPEPRPSLHGLLRDRRAVLRRSATILGFAGCILCIILFSIGMSDTPVCPLMRGTTRTVDEVSAHVCLFYIVFSTFIPFLVLGSGEYSRTLPRHYSRWRDGGYPLVPGEDPEDAPKVSPEKRGCFIMVTAWLAALGAAIVLFTGYTTRVYVPLVAALWIYAATQTLYVIAMRKTFGGGE
jgi:hypothetical protein